MIDTHCHLFWEDFALDLDEVIAGAKSAGVTDLIIPGTNLESIRESAAISHDREGVYFAAGIHPQDAHLAPATWLDTVRKWLQHPRCVAVGEIGLDYYWQHCPVDIQQKAFDQQLSLAIEHDLPVIIHNRDSDDDVLRMLSDWQDGRLRGQFHCFSGDAEYAKKIIDLGFHISFTGNVTYKKFSQDDVLRLIPDGRLLLETDAPFMTPVPHRGKRNTPELLRLTAERIALVREQSLEHIDMITTRNARNLYHI
jgi:TatD DNase family protein